MNAANPGPLVRVMIALNDPKAGVKPKVCVLQEPNGAPGLDEILAEKIIAELRRILAFKA